MSSYRTPRGRRTSRVVPPPAVISAFTAPLGDVPELVLPPSIAMVQNVRGHQTPIGGRPSNALPSFRYRFFVAQADDMPRIDLPPTIAATRNSNKKRKRKKTRRARAHVRRSGLSKVNVRPRHLTDLKRCLRVHVLAILVVDIHCPPALVLCARREFVHGVLYRLWCTRTSGTCPPPFVVFVCPMPYCCLIVH